VETKWLPKPVNPIPIKGRFGSENNDGGKSAKLEKASHMSEMLNQEKEDEAKSQGIHGVPLEQSIYDDPAAFDEELNPSDNQSHKENVEIKKLISEDNKGRVIIDQ
jgi:hypothetical protein